MHSLHSSNQSKKNLYKLIKMKEKLQKIYPRYYNLLIVQDLWQAHCQILLIIFLKELTELNVTTDTLIKNVKLVELHRKSVTVFFKYTNFRNTNVYVVTKIMNITLMKS